jgi:hypothetical protein
MPLVGYHNGKHFGTKGIGDPLEIMGLLGWVGGE